MLVLVLNNALKYFANIPYTEAKDKLVHIQTDQAMISIPYILVFFGSAQNCKRRISRRKKMVQTFRGSEGRSERQICCPPTDRINALHHLQQGQGVAVGFWACGAAVGGRAAAPAAGVSAIDSPKKCCCGCWIRLIAEDVLQ